MNIRKLLLAILLLTTLPVHAEVLERCFKAQMVHKSDCNTNLKPEDCAPGLIDMDPEYWVYLPKGLCEKMTGQPPQTDAGASD